MGYLPSHQATGQAIKALPCDVEDGTLLLDLLAMPVLTSSDTAGEINGSEGLTTGRFTKGGGVAGLGGGLSDEAVLLSLVTVAGMSLA